MNSNQTQPLRPQAEGPAVATCITWQTPTLACLGTVASLTAAGSGKVSESNPGGGCNQSKNKAVPPKC